MCGLSGSARFGGRSAGSDDTLLRRMTRAVAHRGPDETVIMATDPVNLGFVRLSLVDPVGGGQPLSMDDESLVLIANGEVYNHRELAAGLPSGTRLKTGSDCEVLLHLYRRDGLRFLDQVRGMFALVLWDRRNNSLIFARDRFGIKPLFYHSDAERIVFASELKALFEDPRTPRSLNWERALGDQLLSGAPLLETGPIHSWFSGIELVPAATIVTFDLATGSADHHRYWDFPDFSGDFHATESELVRSYGETLASSVAECGMADVEIGLFLSGGIDSAAIAALATPRPRTFTALNASTLRNSDAEFGHRIAKSLGLINHLVITNAAHVPSVEEWKSHLWLMETPLAGPESYYKYEMYRYVGAYAPEIKAMLLGGGADEFNGGYTKALAMGGGWDDFLANIRQMDLRNARNLRPDLGMWWEVQEPSLLRADALEEAANSSGSDAYARYFRWKYRDVQLYNNWHEDRSAAGNGIEARVPFLDHRLVELVAAVPPALRSELIWDKQILRRALHGVLSAEFVDRPKLPFFYGDGVGYTYRMFARMLAGDGGSLVDQALSAPGAKHYLDPDGVRSAVAELVGGRGSGHLEHVLRIVNLGLLDLMTSDLPIPPVDVMRAPVPESIEVADWDAQSEAIESRVLRRRALSNGCIVALREDAMILHEPATDQWFLALDGGIEFVLEEEDTPGWTTFLQALDGKRSLAEAVALSEVDFDAVIHMVAESIDEGLLTVVGATGAE